VRSILNILARRREPAAPITIMTREALRLRHEPKAERQTSSAELSSKYEARLKSH